MANEHSTTENIIRKIGMSVPYSICNEFKAAFKERIKQGVSANSQYRLLLEKLVDPHYKERIEDIKQEMRSIREGTANADFQAYLSWLEKNYDKIDPRTISSRFEEEAIDLFIREEDPQQRYQRILGLIRNWKVPVVPDPFTGRKELLAQLAQRLDPNNTEITAMAIVACHGLGGVGKSFLAAYYARIHSEKYTFVLWFNADNEETLYRQYYDFATVIELPVENQSFDNVIAMVKNWLQQHSGWLIIYDNAPNDQLIAKYRPTKGGKVLITSRKESWNKKDSLAIDVFNIEEARDYIIELTGFALEAYQEKIDELAKTLGYLPLALAQACAYVSVNNLRLEDYLTLYADSRAEMLADKTMPAETFHEPVAITWHITFKAIQEQQSAASALLESCAFLQGNSIPEFLLKELFTKQKPELAKQMKPFIDVMRCLQQYSMLKFIGQKKEDKLFSLHNLVQEVIFDNLSVDKKETYLQEIIGLLKSIFPCQEIEQVADMVKQQRLLPHMEKVLGRVEEWLHNLKQGEAHKEHATLLVHVIGKEWFVPLFTSGGGDKELATLLMPLIEKEWYVPLLELSAHVYSNLGEVRQQKTMLERALVILEKHYGKDHPKVVGALTNLGNAYGDLGEAQKQKALLKRALVIEERRYGKDHPKVALILTNLATAYGDLEEAQEMKALLVRALMIKEKHYGKDHPKVAVTLASLGIAYGALGKARKQKALLERALEIFERYYEKDHPTVAVTLASLGNAYGALGEAQKQKVLLERALGIQEMHYGKDHPEVAITLASLGNAYGALGEAQKQKALLEHALEVFERYYEKNHPTVAVTLTNLGAAYGALGEVQEQKALLERALAIQERYYGKDHPTMAVTLTNLGAAYGALGEAQEQKAVLKRALAIQEKHYGKDHPEVAATLTNLGTAYGALGDARQKKALLERALAIQERHYGKDHPVVAATLTNLGTAYGALGDAREQKALLEQALVIDEKHYGKDHPAVAEILTNLGNAYGALGDMREKKVLLERALVTQERHYGKDHPEVAKVLVNLANSYALQDPSQMKTLLEQALQIEEPFYGLMHPQVGMTLYHLACAYKLLNDAENAFVYAKRAWQIFLQDPSYEELLPYAKAAEELIGKIREQQTTAALSQLLARGPEGYEELASIFLINNQVGQAIAYYEKALELDPQLKGVHHNLACCYHVKGDIEKANSVFQVGIQLHGDSSIYCEYGHFLYQQKRFNEAILNLKKAIEMMANDQGLSYYQFEKTVVDGHLRKEIEGAGGISLRSDLLAYYLLLHCYYQLNQAQSYDAVRCLAKMKVLVNEEKTPLAFRLLAYIYQTYGNEEEAQIHFAQAEAISKSLLTTHPTTEVAGSSSDTDHEIEAANNLGMQMNK